MGVYGVSMEESLSEIVKACNEITTEELAQPSLESENSYRSETAELKAEQKDATDRIAGGD